MKNKNVIIQKSNFPQRAAQYTSVFIHATLASAGISCRRVYVCPSQVSVLLKRLNAGSSKQRHATARQLGNSSFLMPNGFTPTAAPNAGGVG